MMRRDAAGDEIEGLGVEGQCLCIGNGGGRGGEALAAGELAGLVQQLRRDVGCKHARDVRREGGGGVPSPGCDVERRPLPQRCGQFDEAGKTGTLGVHVRGRLVRGIGAELRLHEGFCVVCLVWLRSAGT